MVFKVAEALEKKRYSLTIILIVHNLAGIIRECVLFFAFYRLSFLCMALKGIYHGRNMLETTLTSLKVYLINRLNFYTARYIETEVITRLMFELSIDRRGNYIY